MQDVCDPMAGKAGRDLVDADMDNIPDDCQLDALDSDGDRFRMI